MKYDDAEYYFLNFSTDDLPNEAGAIHIGMYMAWLIANDLQDERFAQEPRLAQVKARQITGCDFIVDVCDCKLYDMDINEEGRRFSMAYYAGQYINDYCQVFAIEDAEVEVFCSVADTWENYDKLAPVLQQRYQEWRKTQSASGIEQ